MAWNNNELSDPKVSYGYYNGVTKTIESVSNYIELTRWRSMTREEFADGLVHYLETGEV